MTRISEVDGRDTNQGPQRGFPKIDQYSNSNSKKGGVILPELQIKSPTGANSVKEMVKANGTNESFLSGAMKSVSSRNSQKNRFFTAKPNRA